MHLLDCLSWSDMCCDLFFLSTTAFFFLIPNIVKTPSAEQFKFLLEMLLVISSRKCYKDAKGRDTMAFDCVEDARGGNGIQSQGSYPFFHFGVPPINTASGCINYWDQADGFNQSVFPHTGYALEHHAMKIHKMPSSDHFCVFFVSLVHPF